MWRTLAGHCIYQSSGGIRVLQNPLFRWLQFDSDALQTVLNRYAPHRPGLRYIHYLILPARLKPNTSCMLGLGGGGAAHALSPLLGHSKLVVVEKNEEVMEVAQRFFRINSLKNITLIHEEASSFISKSSIQFEHLLIDLFTAHGFPKQCNNEEFFAHCKQLLMPEGILALNLANTKEYLPLFQLIQKQFSRSTLALPVPGSSNLIILAQKSQRIDPLINLLQKNNKLKQLAWTNPWGYVASLSKLK